MHNSCSSVHEVAISKHRTRSQTQCESVLGACCGISLRWNAVHLVPSKQSQTFHFRWKWKRLFMHVQCIHNPALPSESFKTNVSKQEPGFTETLSWDEMPNGLLTRYFKPGAWWSEAIGFVACVVTGYAEHNTRLTHSLTLSKTMFFFRERSVGFAWPSLNHK